MNLLRLPLSRAEITVLIIIIIITAFTHTHTPTHTLPHMPAINDNELFME